MLNASTLAAIHQICTNVHLSVDVQELSTLLTVLGVLPQEEQKQVTWLQLVWQLQMQTEIRFVEEVQHEKTNRSQRCAGNGAGGPFGL